MSERFAHSEHLVRMAGLFCVGILAFIILRSWLAPDDFGELGHFRTGAIADSREVGLSYAGRALCESCHEEVVEARQASKHARLSCEICHGPQAAHADDPSSEVPELPEATPLCRTCHAARVARPDWFPTVDVAEHAEGEPCDSCHDPHAPEP